MFGVVLWSDEVDRKAVFWCEDQGDLAYYQEDDTTGSGFCFFDAGDMVQFDVCHDCRLRKARNPRVVHEQACSELPERLLNASQEVPAAQPAGSAQIIAFRPRSDLELPDPDLREA